MQPTTIGLDLAKQVFQVHAVVADGKVLVRRKLRRAEVRDFFAKQPPCLVGMEACASAHYWARELQRLGHTIRLMPATYVKAYAKRGKSDAIDAEAICEAVMRPTMRFVPAKSIDQQAIVMRHRTRDLLVRQRTMLANALRGHLAEFGVVGTRGFRRLEELVAMARTTPASLLPAMALECIELIVVQLEAVAERISAVERSIQEWHHRNEASQRLETIPGIGVITAPAIAAFVMDIGVFNRCDSSPPGLGCPPN